MGISAIQQGHIQSFCLQHSKGQQGVIDASQIVTRNNNDFVVVLYQIQYGFRVVQWHQKPSCSFDNEVVCCFWREDFFFLNDKAIDGSSCMWTHRCFQSIAIGVKLCVCVGNQLLYLVGVGMLKVSRLNGLPIIGFQSLCHDG